MGFPFQIRCVSRILRRKFRTAIDLVDFLVTLTPVSWAVLEETSAPTEMRRSGSGEFTSGKISRSKHHSKEGGEVRIRSDRNDHRNVAAISQGEAEHHRTRKNGCAMSIRATGEGDMGLMSRLNTDKAAYVSRNESARGELATASAYKFIRKREK